MVTENLLNNLASLREAPKLNGQGHLILNESCNRKLVYPHTNNIFYLRIANDNDLIIIKDLICKELEKNKKITSLTGNKCFVFNLPYQSDDAKDFESLEEIAKYYVSEVHKMNSDFNGAIFINIESWIERFELNSKKFKSFIDFLYLVSKECNVYLYSKDTDMDDENVLDYLNKNIKTKLYPSINLYQTMILFELKKVFKKNKIKCSFDENMVGNCLAKEYLNNKDYRNLDRYIEAILDSNLTSRRWMITNDSFCNFLGDNYFSKEEKTYEN